MSGICGWTGTKDHSLDIYRMVKSLEYASNNEPKTIICDGSCIALVSRSKSAIFYQDNEYCLAVEGQPRWGENQIAISSAQDLAEKFISSYRDHGSRVLENIHGHFSIALSRKDGSETFLATDRTGSQPLKYAIEKGTLIFGTSADAISCVAPSCRELEHQALYNYVYFEMVPAPGTAFRKVRRLLPGQYLYFKDGHPEVSSYWRPDYLESDTRSWSDLKRDLLTLLEASVKSSLNGDKPGAFLSGGIDSSTVTGMLSRISSGPARSYSIGFDAPGYDEISYARITANHFGTEHHEYYVTPHDVAEAAPEVAAAYDAPFGNASAIPSLYCARLAKTDGVDQLLGGDGGDELFGGNARYARQWIFSLYDYLPQLMRSGLIEPILSVSISKYFSPLRKLQSYVRQASTPMPERAESYNLMNRLGPRHIFTDDFFETIDPAQPLLMLSSTYNSAQADNLLERMLAVDMRFTLSDNDLLKVGGMCDLSGVGVSFPFLDDRLISFAERLPAKLKVNRTQLRYFFKKAIQDFLPAKTITKSKHGFGLPFGVWLKTDPTLLELSHDSLSSLKCRKIIRQDFIDELLSDKINEHAAYYGTMVWILMMLELWLQARKL